MKQQWRVNIDTAQPAPDRPIGHDIATPPVIAQGMVFIGLKDRHQVVALDATTGEIRWRFTAGGRLDVAPTIYKGMCLFGSADGWAYGLKASDGKLVWRYQAAPLDRRIPVLGQWESEWPVSGGVLVEKGTAFFAAGRSNRTAGGLKVFALDPQSGNLKWCSEPKIHRRKPRSGVRSDLLVAGEDGTLSIGGSIEAQFEMGSGKPIMDRAPYRMLMAYPFNRNGRKFGVCAESRLLDHQLQFFGGIYAQQVVWDPTNSERTFASRYHYFKWQNSSIRGSMQLMHKDADGLFQVKPNLELKLPIEFGNQGLRSNFVIKDPPQWYLRPPEGRRFTSLILAGDKLLAACPLDHFERKASEIFVVSAKDGNQLSTITLKESPAAEGLAVAYGKLFVSMRNGEVLCYGKE